MKYIFTLALSIILLGCSSPKEETVHATRLDSLFNFSREELQKIYMGKYTGAALGIKILDTTIDAVLLQWPQYNPLPPAMRPTNITVRMPLVAGLVSTVSKKWKTKSGILPGTSLKEVEKIRGEFEMNVRRHGGDFLDGDSLQHLEYDYHDTLYYRLCFDKGEGNVGLKNDEVYKSSDERIQKMNPRVYSISLYRSLTPEDEEAAKTAADDAKTDLARQNGDSTMIENVVPFIAFYSNFISSHKLSLISLPFDQSVEVDGIPTNDSPEGAFKNREHENDKVLLVGLLPDTTNYYGIVWRKKPYWYIINAPRDFYNTYITTFSKDGRILANVLTYLDKTEGDPTDCGITTETDGLINADLSFSSNKLMHLSCDGDDIKNHDEVERLKGQVNKDGTIIYQKEERHKLNE